MERSHRSRRRGRPPHPDILTPAEWRILVELRQGLTNAAIAERLNLSVPTVKTHIANMMAKLDRENRQSLAAWEGDPAPVSQLAIERFPLILPLQKVFRHFSTVLDRASPLLAVAVVSLVSVIALAAAQGQGVALLSPGASAGTQQTELPSLDDFRNRVDAALVGSGTQTLHLRVATRSTGGNAPPTESDLWVDAVTGAIRLETRDTVRSPTVHLVVDDIVHSQESTSPTRVRPELWGIESFGLMIHQEHGISTPTLQRLDFEGRSMFALQQQVDVSERHYLSDANCVAVRHLFDAVTYEPIALWMKQCDAPEFTLEPLVRYHLVDRIDPSSLPKDFFDPASLP